MPKVDARMIATLKRVFFIVVLFIIIVFKRPLKAVAGQSFLVRFILMTTVAGYGLMRNCLI